MQADGQQQRPLTTTTSQESEPAWSPDSGRIVFTEQITTTSRLIVSTTDGATKQPITSLDLQAANPAWSPNGRYISFVATTGAEVGVESRLYVTDADGTDLVQLRATQVGVAQYMHPQWSPDSSQIVYQVAAKRRSLDVVTLRGTDSHIRISAWESTDAAWSR